MTRPTSIHEDLRERLVAAAARLDSGSSKFAQYHDDPVAFFREVLGLDLWSRQREIAASVAVNDRVTVRSGNGVGKTELAAGLALWFVKTRGPGARVLLTSAKGENTEQALWRAVRIRYLRAKVHLGGELPKLGKTGWHGPEDEQIVVVTADQAEGFQGLRASAASPGQPPPLLIIADEASGIDERILEAIESLLTAGGKMLVLGNPLRSEGYFFEIHKDGSQFVRFHVSSIESPLVTREWIEWMRTKWGPDSVVYRVRVLGEFVINEQRRAISLTLVTQSAERRSATPDEGVLRISIDPAGHGRDETVFCFVRGLQQIDQLAFSGLSEDEILAKLRAFVRERRRPDEIPMVLIDSEGPIGSSLLYRALGISNTLKISRPSESFECFGVKASAPARREPALYDRTRDELVANLAKWLQGGGAILDDVKLQADLLAYEFDLNAKTGKLQLNSKDKLRAKLGRSPDRGDALALAVWQPSQWVDEVQTVAPEPASAPQPAHTFDPYDAVSGGGSFDPYAMLDQSMRGPRR